MLRSSNLLTTPLFLYALATLTAHTDKHTLARKWLEASIHFASIRFLDSEKKRRKKRKDPFSRYSPRHLPPLPFSDSPQINDRAAFPPPVVRGMHVSFRGAFQLQTRWIPASGIRIPVDGPSYCEYRFQPGKKQICPRLLLPSPGEKKNKVDLFGKNIYICICENRSGYIFSRYGRLRRVVVRWGGEREGEDDR